MSTRESLADPLRIDRKDFLRMGGLGVAAVVLGTGVSADPAFAQTKFSSNPFTLGVASGDPLPDGVVIWTRLAPIEGDLPNRRIRVRYEVAKDEAMSNVVKKGETSAKPEFAHSVHVDVRDLRPGHEYFYRFKAGGETSPVGRTKTAPAFGDSLSELSFAFFSCQDYQNGFYAAYGRMAEEEDLDFVLHLGDYIYEYGPEETSGGPRVHTMPPKEIITLADYRDRHTEYRRDAQLQEAHRVFPWIVTLDDHETENNYADEIPEEGSETSRRRRFLRRRAASYQAYYEHMPLRRSSLPQGPDMLLYRRLTYGDLFEVSVLDTRQYRTDQPCGDGIKERCAEALSERQTITGPKQERWLLNGLGDSRARWNVIAQQTMLAQFDFNGTPGRGENKELFNMDQWDGYVAARNRLIGYLDKKGIRNLITLTGDIHSNWVHDLKIDFEEPGSRTVGTEFVGTSITSSFPDAFLPVVQGSVPDNPHTKFFDGANRGYVVCNVDKDQWEMVFKGVVTTRGNGSVSSPEQPSFTIATFVVNSDEEEQGATQTSGAPTQPGVEAPPADFADLFNKSPLN